MSSHTPPSFERDDRIPELGIGKTIDDALARCRPVPVSLHPFEGEGRTGNPPPVGTVAQEAFEPSSAQALVVGRDVDRGTDAEATGGLPGEHVIGDLTFEQAVLLLAPRGLLLLGRGSKIGSCLTTDLLVRAKKLLMQPDVFRQGDCVMRFAR